MPKSIAISIAGVARTTLCSEVRYSRVQHGVGTASMVVTDPAGVYSPARRDLVEITVGGTLRWAGWVHDRQVRYSGEFGFETVIDCQEVSSLFDRVIINGIWPGGTLKQLLTDVVSGTFGVLDDLGVTLAAGQATGDTLGVLTIPWWTARQLLDYVSALVGWPYDLSPALVLEMFAPGSRASGVTLSRANENVIDASWREHQFDYVNRVWVRYGPAGVLTVTDTWVGGESDGPDGSRRQFVQRYDNSPTAPPKVRILPDDVTKPVGVYGIDALEWTYDAATTSLRHDAAYTALSLSQSLEAVYDSTFPNQVFTQDAAEVATEGEWNAVVLAPDILMIDEARTFGDAVIRQAIVRAALPSIVCTDDSLNPGDSVAVDLTDLGGLSDTCLIRTTSVELKKADSEVDPVVTLGLLGDTEAVADGDALWSQIIGGGGASVGGGGGSSGSSGTTTVLARRYATLGGSNLVGFTGTAGSWFAVPEAKELTLYTADYPSGVATVRVWCRTANAATSVRLRVAYWTGAAWAEAAAMAGPSTATTADGDPHTIVLPVQDGRRHRLEYTRGAATTDEVYGWGHIE